MSVNIFLNLLFKYCQWEREFLSLCQYLGESTVTFSSLWFTMNQVVPFLFSDYVYKANYKYVLSAKKETFLFKERKGKNKTNLYTDNVQEWINCSIPCHIAINSDLEVFTISCSNYMIN